MCKGAPKPLKDALGKFVAEYNRVRTNKRHRVDSSKRSLVYNMFLGFFFILFLFFPVTASVPNKSMLSRLRASDAFCNVVHQHYDIHKHESSGGGCQKVNV